MKTFNYTLGSNLSAEKIDFDKFKDENNLLVQIFCGQGGEALESLREEIVRRLPRCVCIGTTTDGEINNNKISTYKTVVALSVFDDTVIKSYSVYDSDSFKNGREIAKNLHTETTKLIITFTDGTITNGEEFLKGVADYDDNIVISGGMAGDNGFFKETFLCNNEKTFQCGSVGVSLNSDVLHVMNGYKFDWVPIGVEHTIDKIEGDRVFEISGLTAVDFYKKYLGESFVHAEYPLIVQRDGISVARAALSRYQDGSLRFSGNLFKGDIVKLGFASADSIMKRSQKLLNSIKNIQAESFFIYSCMARRRYAQDLNRFETKPFADLANTSGFYTYAEFFHENRKNSLFNQTLTYVGLSEQKREDSTITRNYKPYTEVENSYTKTRKAFGNLITRSVEDYQEQSRKLEEEKEYSQYLLINQKRFLQHTVHETRTPLSVIMSNIELYELEHGKNQYTTNIEIALKNLFTIYDDLSYLVKKDQITYPKQKIDLKDFLRSRVYFFNQVANKVKSNLKFSHSDEEFFIYFNENKLQRIIDNNITNAIKYTHENKEITITLERVGEILKVIFSSHSRMIQFPEKIFEEYYREEVSKDGFGLGLNLVKRVCEEEGVEIDLVSDKDLTSFTYSFKGIKV